MKENKISGGQVSKGVSMNQLKRRYSNKHVFVIIILNIIASVLSTNSFINVWASDSNALNVHWRLLSFMQCICTNNFTQ